MLALALALVLVLEFFPPAVAQEPASPPVTTAALSGVDPGPVVPVGEHGPTVVDVVGAVEAAVTPPATPDEQEAAVKALAETACGMGAPVTKEQVGGLGVFALGLAGLLSMGLKRTKVKKGARDIAVPAVTLAVTGVVAIAVTGALGVPAAALAGSALAIAMGLHGLRRIAAKLPDKG